MPYLSLHLALPKHDLGLWIRQTVDTKPFVLRASATFELQVVILNDIRKGRFHFACGKVTTWAGMGT